MEGRIRNVKAPVCQNTAFGDLLLTFDQQPLSLALVPLARLCGRKPSTPDSSLLPLSCLFTTSTDANLPSNLLPSSKVGSTSPTSTHSPPMRRAEPLSPHRTPWPINFGFPSQTQYTPSLEPQYCSLLRRQLEDLVPCLPQISHARLLVLTRMRLSQA